MNLEIMEFVETQILPQYRDFGPSHGIRHVQSVIKESLELAKILGADEDMAYVVAAYHDLGLSGPRAIHHLTGGKILFADARLKKWFSPDQIRIMKEAVEDHRASSSNQPRSIYGKIVAEADRELNMDTVFTRAIQYGLERYPEKDKEEQWQRFKSHMQEKYSENGYIRLWIFNSPNERRLKELRRVIDDEAELRAHFDRLFNELYD
jgi:uncharacterized protein